MQPEASAYLWDARNAADRIASFIYGVSGDSYVSDELRRSAVERQLEIIGEALNNLRKNDPDTAARIPGYRPESVSGVGRVGRVMTVLPIRGGARGLRRR